MGKYTIQNIKNLDAKIEKDLNVVKTKLLEAYGKNIIAIILTGGFGRGEGSFLSNKHGVFPFNDYDLLIVTRNRLSKQRLSDVSKSLAREIGIRFVDIGAITLSNFRKMPLSVFSFDLGSSIILYGPENILGELPAYDATQIKIEEAGIFLRNRLICFFELTPDNFFSDKNILDKGARKDFILQISKAIIAATEAYLIKEKKYCSSYIKQLSVFLEGQTYSKWQTLVRDAYEIKIGIRDPIDSDPWTYWQDARTFFLYAVREILSPGESAKEIARYYGSLISGGKDTFAPLRQLAKLLLFNEKMVSAKKYYNTELATLLLLSGIGEDNSIREDCLGEIKKSFGQISKNESYQKASSLSEIKNTCVDFWERYHH